MVRGQLEEEEEQVIKTKTIQRHEEEKTSQLFVYKTENADKAKKKTVQLEVTGTDHKTEKCKQSQLFVYKSEENQS